MISTPPPNTHTTTTSLSSSAPPALPPKPPCHSPYYTQNQFNALIPLSIIYTTIAHIMARLLPSRFQPPLSPLAPNDCCNLQKTTTTRSSSSTKQQTPKYAIVTGANTGIGYHTSLSLVKRGYHVILGCRSRDSAVTAANRINNAVAADGGSSGKAIVSRHPLDLSNLSSVRTFATDFLEGGEEEGAAPATLHILVNNAGINTPGRKTFHTNFIGHYLLTRLLLPSLERAAAINTHHSEEAGRIVNVSSVMHHFIAGSKVRLDDELWWERVATEKNFSDNTYAESKLAAILFTEELNERYYYGRRREGKGGGVVRAVSVNPGAVNSDIWRSIPPFLLKYIFSPIFRVLYLTPSMGSTTSVAAAVGRLPEDAVYIQPYYQPNNNDDDDDDETTTSLSSLSFQRRYGIPFPMFEMLGLYVGHAVTKPRLPRNKKVCARALWNACERIVKFEEGCESSSGGKSN